MFPKSFHSSDAIPFVARNGPITPRQRDLRAQLELPQLQTYPVPPTITCEEPEELRKAKLLEMYREFALELHTGMYLTQLTSNRDYADIHVQLMEDLTTLKLDQSNGRIIEFPLTNVSKVYRIVKNDDKWCPKCRSARMLQPPLISGMVFFFLRLFLWPGWSWV